MAREDHEGEALIDLCGRWPAAPLRKRARKSRRRYQGGRTGQPPCERWRTRRPAHECMPQGPGGDIRAPTPADARGVCRSKYRLLEKGELWPTQGVSCLCVLRSGRYPIIQGAREAQMEPETGSGKAVNDKTSGIMFDGIFGVHATTAEVTPRGPDLPPARHGPLVPQSATRGCPNPRGNLAAERREAAVS